MVEQQEKAAKVEAPAKEQVETPLESVSSICTVLAVGLFLMTFIFQNYVIPSGSMEKDTAGWRSRLRRPDFPGAGDQMGSVRALP